MCNAKYLSHKACSGNALAAPRTTPHFSCGGGGDGGSGGIPGFLLDPGKVGRCSNNDVFGNALQQP